MNARFLEVFEILTSHGYEMRSITAPDMIIDRDLIEKSLSENKDLIGNYNFLVAPRGRVPAVF